MILKLIDKCFTIKVYLQWTLARALALPDIAKDGQEWIFHLFPSDAHQEDFSSLRVHCRRKEGIQQGMAVAPVGPSHHNE